MLSTVTGTVQYPGLAVQRTKAAKKDAPEAPPPEVVPSDEDLEQVTEEILAGQPDLRDYNLQELLEALGAARGSGFRVQGSGGSWGSRIEGPRGGGPASGVRWRDAVEVWWGWAWAVALTRGHLSAAGKLLVPSLHGGSLGRRRSALLCAMLSACAGGTSPA